MELDNKTLNDLKLLRNSFKYYKKEHLIQNMSDEDLFFKYGDYSESLYASWIKILPEPKSNIDFINYVENKEKGDK